MPEEEEKEVWYVRRGPSLAYLLAALDDFDKPQEKDHLPHGRKSHGNPWQMDWTQFSAWLSAKKKKMMKMKWKSINQSYQLVLISSDSSKLGLRKDKSSVFFLLYICYRSVDSISSFNQIDSRLEFVHRVQYYLQKYENYWMMIFPGI